MIQYNSKPPGINPNGAPRASFGAAAFLRRRGGAALLLALCVAAWLGLNGQAIAADKVRVAAQKTGTFSWELAVIKSRGLDKGADLDIEVTEFASPESAKIALMGGAVDLIITDWLWVARERSLGGRLLFEPYSTALGAVMVPADSSIKSLEDLRGRKLAVAGGPLDKSWLMLRALAQQDNLDLRSAADVVYGAPSLLYPKALNGEVDASLNYWTFCVSLEAQGFRRLIGMDEVETRLGAKDRVAMVGYVFPEAFAQSNSDALERFLRIAGEARETLANSDDEWAEIGRRIAANSDAETALYRRTYFEGIPRRPAAAEFADASALYRILAKIGGSSLVGDAAELDPGIYFRLAADRPPAEN